MRMKAFFLTGSILLTALILIIAFENLAATAQGFMMLFTGVDSGFFIVLGLSLVGIVTGVFYTGLVMNLIGGKSEDEESPGAEW
jgi:hypothetical protein